MSIKRQTGEAITLTGACQVFLIPALEGNAKRPNRLAAGSRLAAVDRGPALEKLFASRAAEVRG